MSMSGRKPNRQQHPDPGHAQPGAGRPYTQPEERYLRVDERGVHGLGRRIRGEKLSRGRSLSASDPNKSRKARRSR